MILHLGLIKTHTQGHGIVIFGAEKGQGFGRTMESLTNGNKVVANRKTVLLHTVIQTAIVGSSILLYSAHSWGRKGFELSKPSERRYNLSARTPTWLTYSMYMPTHTPCPTRMYYYDI